MRLEGLKMRILETLTWRCRCATDGQLAVALSVSLDDVRRSVRSLKRARLADCRSTRVVAFQLAAPLVVWEHGGMSANFSALAWQLQKRWYETPRQVRRVIWATKWAPRLIGGVGGFRQPLQLEHDLGVTEVFARRSTDEQPAWLSEDMLRRSGYVERGEKVPDAAILDGSERIVRVIEFGGQYSRRRLESFHHYWATRRRMAYEIW